MICATVKKVGLGVGATALVLGLMFGTKAPSYVKTAFLSFRENVQDAIPLDVQIRNLSERIEDLQPAIDQAQIEVVEHKVDLDALTRELAEDRDRLATKGETIVAIRDEVAADGTFTVSEVTFDREVVERDLEQKLDSYNRLKSTITSKEKTLQARMKAFEAGRQRLASMVSARNDLREKLEAMKAQLASIEAAEQTDAIEINDGPLAELEQQMSDLERRLSVRAQLAEDNSIYLDGGLPAPEQGIEESRNVLDEIDETFGTTDSQEKGGQGRRG